MAAAIMVSEAREQAIQAAGGTIPVPQKIYGLIDTGASISAVDPSVLTALGLTTPSGQADIHTPSTLGTPVSFDTYDVRIAILAGRPGDLHFISDTVQVTATPLSASHGFQALLGTDLLRKCILHYNGADGIFTVSY